MKPFLSIRKITTTDIPYILSYWGDTSTEDLIRMGELKRPDEQENQKFLKWFCENNHTLEEAGEDIVIWQVDGKVVGYATLKQFKIPEYGQLHLHIWAKDMRGKGYGAVFFCLSVLNFRKKYGICELYCMPKADNPMPNQMLTRIGFSVTESKNCPDREYSEGLFVKHTKYHLTDEVACKYLALASGKFRFRLEALTNGDSL